MDHTANHYLALAAIIVVGIEGLKHNLKLNEPYSKDPGLLT